MTKMPKHVYAIGIAGVGVSAIARYFIHHGVKVSGSDPRPSPLIDDLKQLGADIVTVPDGDRLRDVDLVVYSDDVPPDQPERRAANELNITAISFAAALGQIMDEKQIRLTVAGTNGKSTTTAILGLLLDHGKKDPTVFVGSRVSEFKGNLRVGRGPIFVAEADEYRDHFLHFHPTAALITNVELDHVEYFKTTDRMERSYQEFVSRLGAAGQLIINADDPSSIRLWLKRPNTISFGFSETADVRIIDYKTAAGQETFKLSDHGQLTDTFTMHVPGRHNVMNAVGALTMAHALGLEWSAMIEPLRNFHGIWRRFEIIKPGTATIFVNDYAHHPTSVEATISGAKAFYPGRRIIAVFQPHHRHRLRALFNDFSQSFAAADVSVITDVYTVAGREADESDAPTSKDLTAAITAHGQVAEYTPSLTDVVNTLAGLVKPGDVVLLMGAGDIWTIGESLAAAYD